MHRITGIVPVRLCFEKVLPQIRYEFLFGAEPRLLTGVDLLDGLQKLLALRIQITAVATVGT